MATTTNYGWTTPDDTSLVKDGASAIRTLGSSIDTSLNNALGTKKAGLVLLNTTSFSAVNSQSLPTNTFSSTYDTYKIILEMTGSSATGYFTARLRAAGSDNSTSNYSGSLFSVRHADNTTNNDNGGTGQTSFNRFGYLTSGQGLFADITLFNPFKTSQTTYNSYFTPTANAESWVCGGRFAATTSFDSLTLIPSSGTITGTIYVYGVNK